ncbi:MAG: phenylacetate--CoA ligase family protein [Desulfamplus sp.]|nr:phenylacetate--CoA ligase family protein [Desulfamplus sp.]MBF0389434.1 phenylacetate--CoA ligase family protein [Desulfamplus sp.]
MQPLNLTIEDKNQLKLERLQSTLNRAYKNVPFHRNRFIESNLMPENLLSLDQIERLPLMDRSHLGIHYPYGLFAVPLRDIVRIHTAPGTGTNPSISGYTKADLIIWQKLVARSLEAAGVTSMDILQINLPPALANWGRDYKDGAENVGASVIPNSLLSLEKTLMVLRDYKTTTLVTTLVFAEQLMECMFKSERNPNEFNLKRVILVGEPVSLDQIKNLQEHLHIDVWLNYGLSEIPGPAIGFECLHHCGMHINDDHILPEIIDPVTKKRVELGKAGELVLTTLSARAFPLIRFRTGDMARFLKEPCKCGSSLISMEWLPERADNMMIISGIKISREQVKLYLKDALGVSEPLCQMEKIRHGGNEILAIALVIDDSLFSDEIKNLEKLMINTSEKLAELIGVPVKITLTEQHL